MSDSAGAVAAPSNNQPVWNSRLLDTPAERDALIIHDNERRLSCSGVNREWDLDDVLSVRTSGHTLVIRSYQLVQARSSQSRRMWRSCYVPGMMPGGIRDSVVEGS